jgi:hypothetical protein
VTRPADEDVADREGVIPSGEGGDCAVSLGGQALDVAVDRPRGFREGDHQQGHVELIDHTDGRRR